MTTVDHGMKNEPLMTDSGRRFTEFPAYRQEAASETGEEGTGGNHGVSVSEMSALTNELDGEGKVGKRDTA